MNAKLMIVMFISNIISLTVVHYHIVDCLQSFSGHLRQSSSSSLSRYNHDVPYNIYGLPSQMLTNHYQPHQHHHSSSVYPDRRTADVQYMIPYRTLQQAVYSNHNNHNDHHIRRQFVVGSPIRAPLPLPALGKSKRLFSNFINLRQSQIISSVLAGPLVCIFWAFSPTGAHTFT